MAFRPAAVTRGRMALGDVAVSLLKAPGKSRARRLRVTLSPSALIDSHLKVGDSVLPLIGDGPDAGWVRLTPHSERGGTIRRPLNTEHAHVEWSLTEFSDISLTPALAAEDWRPNPDGPGLDFLLPAHFRPAPAASSTGSAKLPRLLPPTPPGQTWPTLPAAQVEKTLRHLDVTARAAWDVITRMRASHPEAPINATEIVNRAVDGTPLDDTRVAGHALSRLAQAGLLAKAPTTPGTISTYSLIGEIA